MAVERIVLDASVAVEWFLPGGGATQRYAENILERISTGESAANCACAMRTLRAVPNQKVPAPAQRGKDRMGALNAR